MQSAFTRMRWMDAAAARPAPLGVIAITTITKHGPDVLSLIFRSSTTTNDNCCNCNDNEILRIYTSYAFTVAAVITG